MIFLSKGSLEKRHRLVILTDMENEPDDSQTMVKLLMYSNEIDIEGLVAVTSRWLSKIVFPESIIDRVHAYGVVRKNLMIHAKGWPDEALLLGRVAGGQRGYGMKAVGDAMSSPGSELIVKALQKDDSRPLWFAINAGANTLAQALWDIRKNFPVEEAARLVSKVRVLDDSGQDDAGAWMCHEFPELFYIRSRAQVFGLFGPKEDTGPQPWAPYDQYDWAELNVRTRHGVLGALYPQRIFKDGKFMFMEGGGTGSWLGLANKGLCEPEEINWGGWSGRFSWKKEQVPAGQFEVDKDEEPYFPFLMYPQAEDYSFEWEDNTNWTEFSGVRGDKAYSAKVFFPLWRWRNAYTNDFKARMDWCVADYMHANHHPVINLMGDEHRTVVRLSVDGGEHVELDASKSWDPDDKIRLLNFDGEDNLNMPERLNFRWFYYPEAGSYDGKIAIDGADSSVVRIAIPADAVGTQIHIVLEVTDCDDDAPLTSYRRVVMDVK